MRQTVLPVSILFFSALLGSAEADDKEQAAIAAIEQAGGTVRIIAADTEDREVQYYLSDKEVTDEALTPLREVSNVVWLNLRGTKITDAGLVHLKELNGLTRLHLEKTGIGDAGLAHLAGLTNIEYLNLYGTQVTDAGLEHLKGLKKIKKLYLWQTQVTAQGVEKLKASLPDVVIVRDGDTEP